MERDLLCARESFVGLFCAKHFSCAYLLNLWHIHVSLDGHNLSKCQSSRVFSVSVAGHLGSVFVYILCVRANRRAVCSENLESCEEDLSRGTNPDNKLVLGKFLQKCRRSWLLSKDSRERATGLLSLARCGQDKPFAFSMKRFCFINDPSIRMSLCCRRYEVPFTIVECEC